MKKIIIFFCFYCIACTKPEPLVNYNAAYFLAEWQRQYATWGYSYDSCCYADIDSSYFVNKYPENGSKEGLRSFSFFSRHSYCGFTGGFVLKHEQKYYMWGNTELFEPLFWRIKPNKSDYNLPRCRTDMSTEIDSNKHFFVFRTWASSIEMREVYLPDGYNGGKLFFNNIFFAETQKEGGQIFDISDYGQFSQLNEFLYDNPEYHGRQNLSKIDTLLFELQDIPRELSEETIPHTHIRVDINSKKIALNNKTSPNDSILQKRGVDFLASSLVYFDGVETVFRNKNDGSGRDEYKDTRTYKGYLQKKDSLNILHDYLQQQKPSFLYYKAAGHSQSLWYNYFLAFYVSYDEYQRPKITKVDLICPRRVYHYLCYPNYICDDMGRRSLFHQICNNKYREISRKQQNVKDE
jgi:hypothetical protein